MRGTPLVCYDLRFPEPFRLAADGTDLFAVVADARAKFPVLKNRRPSYAC